MKKILKVEVIEFRSPVCRWEINLTPEKQFHKIDAIYDESMNFISPEYTLVEEFGDMVLDFGLEPLKGYLRYSWVETIPDDYNDNNNNVVINIDNSDSCCGVDGASSIITKIFNDNIEFKIAELSADTVIFNYSIKNAAGGIEAGKLYILNESTLNFHQERFTPNNLLPLTFSVNKNNNTINIKIISTDVISNTLKYKTTIF